MSNVPVTNTNKSHTTDPALQEASCCCSRTSPLVCGCRVLSEDRTCGADLQQGRGLTLSHPQTPKRKHWPTVSVHFPLPLCRWPCGLGVCVCPDINTHTSYVTQRSRHNDATNAETTLSEQNRTELHCCSVDLIACYDIYLEVEDVCTVCVDVSVHVKTKQRYLHAPEHEDVVSDIRLRAQEIKFIILFQSST